MDYSTLTQALIEKLDLTGVQEEVQMEVITHIGDTIIERTMLAVTSALSEEEAILAQSQLLEGDIEGFMNMLKENHPELDATVVAITNEVIDEFLEARKG